MPVEIRHILFTEQEVVSALADFHRRAKEPLPAGTIARFSVLAEPSVRVEMDIDRDGEGQRRRNVVVEKEKLAAALILFCKMKRIPLPASSFKVLRVINKQLTLVVSIGTTPEEADKLGRTL